MTKVKAKVRGFDGIKLREPGEVFEFPGEVDPTWMTATKVETVAEVAPVPPETPVETSTEPVSPKKEKKSKK